MNEDCNTAMDSLRSGITFNTFISKIVVNICHNLCHHFWLYYFSLEILEFVKSARFGQWKK